MRRGLSIVEVGVSIAVLVILAGLLVPALSGARRSARAARCQANLRQMAVAAQHYVALHDRWPAAILYEKVDGQLRQVAWDYVTGFFDGALVGPGPLWTFTDDPGETMQCPDYHGDTNFDDPFTGYDYNTSYIGDEEAFSITGNGTIRRGVRPATCRRACDCALFGDGGRAGGTNKFMRAPLNLVESDLNQVYAGAQAYRHAHATSVAYIDGHVASTEIIHPGPLATDSLLHNVMGFPENGFLSDDNAAYDPR